MTFSAGTILSLLVAAVGLLVVLSLAARRKRKRLGREQEVLTGDRKSILDALRNGERICSVLDTSDRRDLDIVQELLSDRGIPSILDEENWDRESSGYLPRDTVPLALFVLRKDEPEARRIIAGYLADKGRRSG